MDNQFDNSFLESPMNKFCYTMDKKLFGKPIFDYYDFVERLNPTYMTNLLLADFRFRCRTQLNILIEIYGQQGCQPKNSKVLMADGCWKNIQDIKIGDEVLSPQLNGKNVFAKVINLTSWFSSENYDVVQLNRTHKKLYSCSYNHLIPHWDYKRIRKTINKKRKFIKDNYYIKKTMAKEYAKIPKYQKNRLCGFSSFEIKKFKNQSNATIEPYSLGVWLGDGSFYSKRKPKINKKYDKMKHYTKKRIHNRLCRLVEITNSNFKILEEVSKYYPIMNIYTKKGTNAKRYSFSINGDLTKQLIKYGLEGKKSGVKFIPKDALLSDINYRKRLLSGLIDTDGYYRGGGYSITTKSKQLAKDILFLVHSIGGRALLHKIKKGIKKLNFVGTYYRVSFYLKDIKLSLLVKYKIKKTKSFYRAGNIIAINVIKGKPCQVFGFTLDSPSHLYITDNFMITNNCGKSLFGQDLAGRIGKIYDVPFNMKQNTVADFDILDSVLHNSPFRTTFVVDEQPVSMYGYGSSRVRGSLKDYEEICRYTMKNIIYISPSQREHSSYYLFKEDMRPSVERFKNENCLKCSKQKECLKIYAENKFKPLCDEPFWHRHGYPTAFNFMLCTTRKTDNQLLPRGYVRLPVIPPKMMRLYDTIKQRNIAIFENKESLGWVQQRKELQEFQEKYKSKILKENGKTVPKNLIKAYLQDYFGSRSFTTTELDIFCAIIKAEIGEPNFSETAQQEFNEERIA